MFSTVHVDSSDPHIAWLASLHCTHSFILNSYTDNNRCHTILQFVAREAQNECTCTGSIMKLKVNNKYVFSFI